MSRIRVLVIDDAAFMRDLVKNSLRAHFPDFALEEAFNGKQAQHRLMQEHFDLVLCDWEMPEMTGDELLTWMRQEPKTQEMPFVMITSRGDRDHVVKAIELGVNNYLVKPFTAEKLIGVVTKELTKSKDVSAKALRGHTKPGLVNSSAQALGARPADVGLSGAVPIAARLSTNEAGIQPPRPVPGLLRVGSSVFKCLVKEISQHHVTVVTRREDGALPENLEAAVFDLQTDEQNGRCSINGCIHQVKTGGANGEFLHITVRFTDEDPKKHSQLESFISSLSDGATSGPEA